MSVTYSGPEPTRFYFQQRRKLIQIVNEELAQLETDLVENTPANTGNLRQGWVISPATEQKLVGRISNNKAHFLPVEMGRRPGSGISREGQESVATWARRKLGLSQEESESFAYMLSRKYFREGRPAAGFAGLAMPGQRGGQYSTGNIEPVEGGLIAKSFRVLDRRLTFGRT
jgi:hypothetical protein